MARIFKVEAPDDLVEATLAAYAHEAGVGPDASPDEIVAAAKRVILDTFREKVLNHQESLREIEFRKSSIDVRNLTEESIKGREAEVSIVIE